MAELHRVFGEWWEPGTDGKRIAGELTWQPPRAPQLTIVNADLETGLSMMEDAGIELVGLSRGPIQLLHGLVPSGGVTLVGLSGSGMTITGVPSFTITARAAIFGVLLDSLDERWFRRVCVSLPELPSMLGEWPLSQVLTPTKRRRKLAVTMTGAEREWKEDGVSMAWKYDTTTSVNPMRVSLGNDPVAIFESSKTQSLEWWMDRVGRQAQLLSISTGRPARPRTVMLWHKKNLTKRENTTTRMEVWARGLDPDAPDRPQTAGLGIVTANDINNNPRGLHGVLDEVMRLSEEQPLFLSLLERVIFSTNRPIENRYLDAVTALEAFDGVKRGDGPMEEDAYKEQRRLVLDAVKVADIDASHQKFLKRWLAGMGRYSLEDRLRALLKTVPTTWAVPPKEVAKLRNDIAHGNSEIDGFQLEAAFDQVVLLGRTLVARELRTLP